MTALIGLPLALAALLLSMPPWGLWWASLAVFPLIWYWLDGQPGHMAWIAAAAISTGMSIVVLFPVFSLSPGAVGWVWLTLTVGFGVFLRLSTGLLRTRQVLVPVYVGAVWWLLEQLISLAGVPWTLALHLIGDSQRLAAAAFVGQSGLAAIWVMLAASLYSILVRAIRPRSGYAMVSLLLLVLVASSIVRPSASQVGPQVAAVQSALEPRFLEQPGQLVAQQRLLGELDAASGRMKVLEVGDDVLVVWPESLLPAGPVAHGRHVAERVRVAPGQAIYHTYQSDESGVRSALRMDGSSDSQIQVKVRPLPGFEDDISPGDDLTVMSWRGFRFLALVCSDAQLLVKPWRTWPIGDAQFAVLAVNDAYMAGTNIALLHLGLDVLTALQTGLPIVRAANGGVTAIISADGEVESHVPLFDRGVIRGQLQLPISPPMYAQHQGVINAAWLLLAGFAIVRARAAPADVRGACASWITVTGGLALVAFTSGATHAYLGHWGDRAFAMQSSPVYAKGLGVDSSGLGILLRSYGLVPIADAVPVTGVRQLKRVLAAYGLDLVVGVSSHPAALSVRPSGYGIEAVLGVRSDGLRWLVNLSTGQQRRVTAAQWEQMPQGRAYSVVAIGESAALARGLFASGAAH